MAVGEAEISAAAPRCTLRRAAAIGRIVRPIGLDRDATVAGWCLVWRRRQVDDRGRPAEGRKLISATPASPAPVDQPPSQQPERRSCRKAMSGYGPIIASPSWGLSGGPVGSHDRNPSDGRRPLERPSTAFPPPPRWEDTSPFDAWEVSLKKPTEYHGASLACHISSQQLAGGSSGRSDGSHLGAGDGDRFEATSGALPEQRERE